MKKITLILTGLIIGLSSYGQGKYGATPADSIACIESLIYKDYLKSEPKLAHDLWRKAYATCPQSQKTLYTNGVKIYKALAKKEKDATLKAAYLDTMLSIYDQRIEMFGQKGLVLGQKGQAMLSTKQDKEKTFAVLSESMEVSGNKAQSGTLVAMMFTVINLEKAGKKTKEDVVTMFEKTLAICAINKDNPKTGARYIKATEKIQNVTAPYLDCTVLVPLADKNFEANKENIDWLRNTVTLLRKNKCYETKEGALIYGKVAESFFAIEPSASGAAGIATIYLSKKDYSNAIVWFEKAVGMAETNDEKAEFTLSIAKAYSYKKSYSQARSSALKAAGLKSGWGEPYILIGDCYAQSTSSCDDGELGKFGVYWVAVDKYQKAKAVDGSVASVANKKIASISSRYPATKDVFFYGKKKGDSYTVKCWINETTTIKTK
ncbi:MAG: tetratricopeptide repeat protein [Vicingaceae bacterium]